MKRLFMVQLILMAAFLAITAESGEISQKVRGQVVDKLSQAPLPGANVIIQGTDPVIGTITGPDGYFLLQGVPVGRVSITAMYVGYRAETQANLIVNSGKELVLKFELEENVIRGEEVIITANRNNKSGAGNSMAAVSSRYFTIEESQRYAGVRNDISRMAANYAGVSTPNDANNDIVIRGNSPAGLLWRLDGTEIPNPNHFGFLGNTGGPVSMLNNNVLMNSVFLTAAFPAEYSDAFSGVFDLRMRNGNADKHEFLGQVGFNGFEGGAEGPLPFGNRSSYLVNYRYSTLGLIHRLGANFGTGVAVPDYEDLTFKINIPTLKFGKFSLTGLGGKSYINFNNSSVDSTELTDDLYTQNQDIENRNSLGAIILNHTYAINSKAYTTFNLSATTIYNEGIVDSLSTTDRSPFPYVRNYLRESYYTARFSYSHKLNSRHYYKAGIAYKLSDHDLLDSVYFGSIDRFVNVLDENGESGQLSGFLQYQLKITDQISLNTGLSYQMLTLNRTSSLEPRAGISWNTGEAGRFSLGYGLHSKAYPVQVYFSRVRTGENTFVQPNKKLDLQKSHHFVLGYDKNLGENWRVKAETYYQYIFNTAIENRPGTFSMANFSSGMFSLPDTLVDGGIGENKGVEITLERFLDNGYYFLMTTSLYDSRYRGSNNQWYSTAFDGGYVLNILSGKDFKLKSKKSAIERWLVADFKLTMAGGQRYTPVDRELSLQNQRTEFIEELTFAKQYDDYFRTDLRIAFRIEGKRITQESGFEIQNLTNHRNPYYSYYNSMTGDLETVFQMGIFPMGQYRIVF